MAQRIFIAGEWTVSVAGDVFDCVDPSTSAALKAGITWQNCNKMVVIQAPWGGVKKSGMGRELGRWGLDAFLEPKHKARWKVGGGVGRYDM